MPLTLAVWAALAATPASAFGAFGLSKLTLNAKNGKENYQYTAGNTVHAAGTADLPDSSAPNRRYRLLFIAPGGGTRAATACAKAAGNGTVSSTYTVGSGDPPSTGAMWTAVLEQYRDTSCTTLEKTSSLPFAVAQASAFPTAALTAPQAFFGAGATAYIRLAGLTPGGDWNTTWQRPNGSTACANTVGADRPDAGADGALPSLAGDFLQYQPGSAGSEWNLQANYDGACPAATTQGAWRVLVERDATHFVTLTAFSVDPKAPTSSATSPRYSQASALTVSYNASDSGGAGLATVDLYARGPGDLGFTKVATDSAPGVTGSFSYLAAGGDGAYSFYTVATDSAGNVEPVPSTPDSTTVVDRLAPTSTAGSPPSSTSPSITVSYTAADLTVDGGGLAKVELYARAPGDAAFTPVAVDSAPGATGSFSYTASAGDGSYDFFTVATDAAGNVEAAPAGADSTTAVDTAAPTSAASAPASSSVATFTIAYEAADPGPAASGLAAVELYAKGPADSDYAKASTDSSPGSSGSITYTASQGTGSYSFFTVATDRAGNAEPPPATADSVTTVDTVVDGTPPASAASSPEYAGAAVWSVSYTASDEGTDASGPARVELYAKGPGDIGYSRAATDESPAASGTFAYAAGDGDGDYAFYTVATDRAGNVEAAPANADTVTRLDTGAPSSSASAPASSTVSTFDVSYTATDAGAAASGVATVELYAKGPGEAAYSKAGTATTGAGTLTYSATRGAGSYSFYTVASDRAGNVESPPSGADATTTYDPSDVATLYVAKNNTNCTDSGSGTATRPFCSIRPAATKATAGQTVRVSEGTYGEVVSVANSGTATAPITFVSAPGENVTVAGGTSGFSIVAKSNVTVEGFTVTGTSGDGIVVRDSSNIILRGNRVTKSGQPVTGLVSEGVRVENTTDSVIADNTVDHNTNFGIYMLNGSTRNEIVGNRVFANARQYERAASGIRVQVSTGNTVASNLSHGNEDSGIELVNAAHDNLVVNNITYGNGDHGIDVTQSSLNVRVIANSVSTSVTSGINVEGASTGGAVINNVAVDNAVNSPRGTGNIRVDATSASGMTIDYNLVWQTGTGRNYEWKGLGYNTIEQMRTVSGQEAHGIQANPRWASPADADFSLTPGSPAIDSANSDASGQLSSDAENRPRLDDPGTPNSGVGPRAYDDRGALEYEAGNRPPVAALTVSPSSGTVDLAVTADASGSVDNDGIAAIAGYTFDWGDGSTATGPQTNPNAAHTYRAAGTYTVTVTVTDTAGASAQAQSTVTVSDDPPQAALVVSPGSGGPPLDVLADASGSTDTDGTPIAGYRFDWGDGSTATGPQSDATARHTYAATGTYTVTVAVEDTAGQTSYATATVIVHGDNVPPTAALSVTPASGPVDLDVTADASASTDPDDGIAGYSFAWGDGTAASGPQSQPTATHTYRAAGTYTITVTVTDAGGGTSTATAKVTVEDLPPAARLSVTPISGLAPLEVTADASGSTDADATPIATYSFDWGDGAPVSGPQPGATATHTYAAAGTYTVTVTVKDTAGQSSTATAQVSVRRNLVANPGFETDLTGWNTSGSGVGATLTRAADGHSGSWAAKLANTGTAAATCTLNDSPDWARTTVAGTYTGALWVRSDTAGATLRLRFREYSASVNVGSAISVATLTGSWQKVSVSYTVASPGSTLDFNAYVSSAAPGTCFYADDVAVHLN